MRSAIFFYCISVILFGVNAVVVEKYGKCDPLNNNYKTSVNTTFRTEGDVQYVDADMDYKIPLSNRLKVQIPILVSKDGIKFKRFITFNDDHACSMYNRLFGKFWVDIQRLANIEPAGGCPIKQGYYRLRNHPLNLTVAEKLPKGTIKMKQFIYLNQEEVGCIDVILHK